MKNWKKIALTFFCVLTAVVWISNKLNTPPPIARIAVTTTPEPGEMIVDEILSKTQKALDKTFPGANWIEYEPDAATVKIFVYHPAFTVDALNAALMDINYLRKWNTTTHSLVELEGELRAHYAAHGHPELRTELSLVNPDDFLQIFATVSDGAVVYDLVDATPPGQQIVSGTQQTRAAVPAADTRSFVVNTSSRKYHRPDCGAIREMKSEHRWDYVGTREDLEALGYEPCGLCGG